MYTYRGGDTRVACVPEPILSEVKQVCSKHENSDSQDLINDLPSVPAGTWLYGIDATALPTALTQDKQVIWFQCPYVDK